MPSISPTRSREEPFYGRLGRRADAERSLATLLARAEASYVPAGHLSIVYFGLGDEDQGFRWLQKAVDERGDWLANMGVDPLFDGRRDDSRLVAIFEQISLFDGLDFAQFAPRG